MGAKSAGEGGKRSANKYQPQGRILTLMVPESPPEKCDFYQKCNGEPWKNLKPKVHTGKMYIAPILKTELQTKAC